MERLSVSPRAALLAAWLLATPAAAHSLRAPDDLSGVEVPALVHGQMSVIQQYRAEIETLATWVAPHDAEVAKLLAFARSQAARCLWGLVPRSIDDEASPFNECSHAYLSADRALLARIQKLPYWPQISIELRDRVDRDMIYAGSSLSLCMFSATPFNTASPVNPNLHDFLVHVPTLFTLLGIFAMGSCLTAAAIIVLSTRLKPVQID